MINLTKKNISFKDIKLDKIDGRYFFVAILVVLLILEAWVVKDSASMVLELANQAITAGTKPANTGINFQDYDKIVKRIQDAAIFKPSGGPDKNPF